MALLNGTPPTVPFVQRPGWPIGRRWRSNVVGVSKRNIAWLIVVVGVGILVGINAGWLWGIVAAIAVLALSESIERTRRKKLRAARGVTDAPHVRDAISSRKRSR